MKFGDAASEDYTESLPTELLWAIIDQMSLRELLVMARVSHKWRRAAFEHRTFRSDIRLYSDTPDAVALFHAQLLRSGTNTIDYMELRVPDKRAAVLHVVAPALTQCLPRVVDLSVWLDVTSTKKAFEALCSAPQLETFSLHIVDTQLLCNRRRHRLNERTARTIPTDIFAGTAPLLRTFRGLGVRFPSAPAPALAGVRHVHLHGEELRHDPALAINRVYARDGAVAPVGPATFSTEPVRQSEPAPTISLVSDVCGMPPAEDSDGFEYESPKESLVGEYQLLDGRLTTTANLSEAQHRSWHAMILAAVRDPLFPYKSFGEFSFSPVATAMFFPAMKTLALRGQELSIVCSSHALQIPEHLMLDLESGAHRTLRHAYAAEIKSVHLVDGSPESVSVCVSQLRGSLDVSLLDTSTAFIVKLSERGTGRERTFEEIYATYDADAAHTPGRRPSTRLNVLILPSSTYPRVQTLTLSQRVWAYVSVATSIPALPAVERLTFVIDVPERDLTAHPLAARLRLPALRHFAVATVFAARIVRAQDLTAVVGQCILNPPETLEFWVHEGVVVRGTFDPRNVIHVGAMPRFTAQHD